MANANVGYAMSKFALTALTHAVRREGMTKPADIAALIAMALLLPGTANVAELLVNCRLESSS